MVYFLVIKTECVKSARFKLQSLNARFAGFGDDQAETHSFGGKYSNPLSHVIFAILRPKGRWVNK